MENNKYKLLSIDLDGTLLTKFKRVTKSDLLSLYNYSKLGGIIFINTGKSLQSTYRYILKLQNITNNFRYCSCLNGNLIYDVNKKEIIYSNSIMADDCKKVFDIVRDHKQKYMSYETPTDKHINLEKQSHIKIFSDRIKQVLHFNNSANPTIKSACKLNILSIGKKIDEAIIDEIKSVADVDVIKTNARLFEVVKRGSNKGTSLKKIMDIYQLNKDDVAAIGDSNNDISMFEASGTSFLVNNKKVSIELRKAATFNVKTRKNKVSKVINNYVLK